MFSLHNHSDYSNARGSLDAITTVKSLVQKSFDLGLKGVALTDHDILSGHFKFLREVEKLNKKGKDLLQQNPNDLNAKRMAEFKGILGNEIYLAEELDGKTFFRHFILLAKDLKGWYQLNELSSRAWSRMYIKGVTRTPTYLTDLEEVIGKDPGHVIASSACLGNTLGDRIIQFGSSQGETRERLKGEILSHISQMKAIFGEDFYLEVQPGQSTEQIIYNQGLVAFGKFTNTKLMATTDSHYDSVELRPVHSAYLKSQNAERETAKFYDYTYLMSKEEVRDFLTTSLSAAEINESIFSTLEIGAKITQYTITKDPIIHRVPYQNEEKWEASIGRFDMEYWNKFKNSDHKDDKFLLYQICEGIDYLQNKGWFEVNDTSLQRIDVELQQIWEVSEKLNQRMSTYFTTMQDIVNEIWKISIVMPGRGSAGAFLINCLLQITQIDPLPFDFPYKRFMAADKASLADIDIDSGASKKKEIFDHLSKHFESFGNILTGIATFGTEKSKSALLTACRGLDYEPEEGLYFASLIPSDRGFPRSLEVCYYGDGEDKKAIPEFVQVMNENPKVWEIAQQIEGLINKRSSHAAGIAIFPKDSFFEQVGLMKTPAGFLITQFDLGCLEEVGVVKYDLLSTDAADSIQTCLYLLADQGYIEWDGSLRDVYNKYLHPKVIDYDSLPMWEQIHRKEVLSLFQFGDSPVGEQAIDEVRPTSLIEMANINSVMRLMAADGGEMPLVVYRRRKENPRLWESQMDSWRLTDQEKEVLRFHMGDSYGMCITQEQLMSMLQDPKIGDFTFLESDSARKVIGKKLMTKVEELHQMFLTKGRNNGVREEFLKYVWQECFAIQMGYSFSKIHTISYSIIAIQEMNLNYFFPSLFWATSRLMTESGALDFLEEDLEILYEDSDEEEEVAENKKDLKIRYFQMSAAINKLKEFGVKIELPDINSSSFTFRPDVETNTIYFGIKGISRVGNKVISEIIGNRPYTSIEDFLAKVKVNKVQITMLIKAGCFDRFISQNQTRQDLIYNYCDLVADKKKKINMQNFARLIELDLIPESYKYYSQLFRYNRHIRKFFLYGTRFVISEPNIKEMMNNFDFDSFKYEDGEEYFNEVDWKRYYDGEMKEAKAWVKENESDLLTKVNKAAVQELLTKYNQGNISYQEMEAISYYHHAHELDYPEYESWLEQLGVENFFDLPEQPQIAAQYKSGATIMQLSRIVGTSIGRDKAKGIVGLLTPDGFLKIKVYRSQFIKYDKQLKLDGQIERSWFSKGNKLLLSGYRNEDHFILKTYKNHPHGQAIYKIEAPGELKSKRLGE